MRLLLTLFCCGLFSLNLQAATLTLEEVEFSEQLAATKHSPELFLRGAGLRKVYGIVKTYVGLLYVADQSLAADQIVTADVAKRMEFRLISNRVTAKRFVNVIEEGLALNTTREEMIAIEPRVQKLFKLFDYKFVKGTIGWIEWVPSEQVSRVVINGEIRGSVPGKDLSDALLRIWVGNHPVSEDFKQHVLGLEPSEAKTVVAQSE